MALIDPELPKEYRDGAVPTEAHLDSWRLAAEEAFATLNLNLTQIRKDCFLSSYDYTNNGVAATGTSLQTQITNLVNGTAPISGTVSDTFTINSDSSAAVLSTSGLTATRTYTFPDISSAVLTDTSTQTVANKTITLSTIDNAASFSPLWMSNIALVRATTTNAGDSIKITSYDGTALSSSNPGYVTLPGVTAGQLTSFTVTADVTILLTGAHWGAGGNGDLTGAILRVLACNDNGTLRWGVALLGGRQTLLNTDTNATQTNINLPEEVLCDVAVASVSSNTCREVGYFRADFDDAGGAAEDLWAIQSGVGDVVTGGSADGLWQPWQPTSSGFASSPTPGVARWAQAGSSIHVQYYSSDGTSDSSSFAFLLPAKEKNGQILFIGGGKDNSAIQTSPFRMDCSAGSRTATIYKDLNGTGFTTSGTKMAVFNFTYEVGPAASFIS